MLALPRATVGEVVDSLVTIWSSSREEEWVDQVHYLACRRWAGTCFAEPTFGAVGWATAEGFIPHPLVNC